MLVIRLQRTGREGVPTYRIVVAEKSWAVKGKFLAILGHYLVDRTPPVFYVDAERLRQWIMKGAQPSNTLARLLHRNGIDGVESFIRPYVRRKPKAEVPAAVGGGGGGSGGQVSDSAPPKD